MKNDFDEVKNRIDLAEFLKKKYGIKQSGSNYFCPLHDDEASEQPSFSINGDFWRCFGQCQDGGSVLDFVMKKENVSLGKALKICADYAGYELAEISEEDMKRAELKHDLAERRMVCAEEFHKELLDNPPIYNRLYERGYTDETIKNLLIGWCTVDAVARLLKKYSKEELQEVSVLSKKKKIYFMDRHIYPLFVGGEILSFTGRTTTNLKGSPKWLNPWRDYLGKGRDEETGEGVAEVIHLYNEDVLRESDWAIIAEGIPDCIALIQAGLPAVAVFGAGGFKPKYVRKFRNVDKVYACFDPDASGEKGMDSVVNILGEKVRVVRVPVKDNIHDVNDWLVQESFKNVPLADKKNSNEAAIKEGLQKFKKTVEEWLNDSESYIDYVVSRMKSDDPLETGRTLEKYINNNIGLLINRPTFEESLRKKVWEELGISKVPFNKTVKIATKQHKEKQKTSALELLDDEYPELNPALDFSDNGFGFVTIPGLVPVKVLDDETGEERTSDYITKPVVITNRRERFEFNKMKLLEKHEILVTNPPRFLTGTSVAKRWSKRFVDRYLEGEEVDPLDVYEEILYAFETYIDFPNPAWAKVVSMWTMGTYIYPIFNAYPYLALAGERASGKTRTMNVAQKTAFNMIMSSDMTPSVLFRIIEGARCTVGMDEAEMLMGGKQEKDPEIRLILQSGYRKDSYAWRTEKEGDEYIPKDFGVYAPKMLANIKGIHETLASRCIVIRTLRSRNKAIMEANLDSGIHDWALIRHHLYVFALTHFQELRDIYEDTSKQSTAHIFKGRQDELWAPILSMATLLCDRYGTKDLLNDIVRLAKEVETALQPDLWVQDIITALKHRLDKKSGKKEEWLSTKEIRDEIKCYYGFDETSDEDEMKKAGLRPPHSNFITDKLKVFGFSRTKKIHGERGLRYFISLDHIDDIMSRYGIED